MKAITEKELIEFFKSIYHNKFNQDEIFVMLKTRMKEIDTLTVSKLRPMEDAPRDRGSILCVLNGSENLQEMYFAYGLWWLSGVDMYFNEDHINGWVPKLIYKPEKE